MDNDSNNNDNNFDNNGNDNLRKLFCDRNPGDARVKVGSEWKVFSRWCRPSFGVGEIGVYYILSCAAGPSKSDPVIWEFTPIKSLITRWDFLLKAYPFSQNNQISSKNRTHSCILAPRGR